MKRETVRAQRPPYQLFEHTADLGVEIYGRDEQELFRNAALALADIMADRSRVEEQGRREIVAEGGDLEELLINFLREVLSLYNSEGWLLKGCEVTEMGTCHLRATATGEPFARGRHAVAVEIKAVTYHGTEICSTPEGWIGRIVCDV